ncbi:SCO family protein [Seohaeicola saemankumensis]|uniref:SCO family protein n=1 Tax=Seohaeicola saemankumensis TaxID=481181 RepID=UPI003AF34483
MLNTVFIPVDPYWDTTAAMAEHVGYFHPQIRRWTGERAQIARAAEGFRVFYEKVALEGGDYTKDHTAGVFLFDATGALFSIIDYHENARIRAAQDSPCDGARRARDGLSGLLLKNL